MCQNVRYTLHVKWFIYTSFDACKSILFENFIISSIWGWLNCHSPKLATKGNRRRRRTNRKKSHTHTKTREDTDTLLLFRGVRKSSLTGPVQHTITVRWWWRLPPATAQLDLGYTKRTQFFFIYLIHVRKPFVTVFNSQFFWQTDASKSILFSLFIKWVLLLCIGYALCEPTYWIEYYICHWPSGPAIPHRFIHLLVHSAHAFLFLLLLAFSFLLVWSCTPEGHRVGFACITCMCVCGLELDGAIESFQV